jgi:hypothetical protein
MNKWILVVALAVSHSSYAGEIPHFTCTSGNLYFKSLLVKQVVGNVNGIINSTFKVEVDRNGRMVVFEQSGDLTLSSRGGIFGHFSRSGEDLTLSIYFDAGGWTASVREQQVDLVSNMLCHKGRSLKFLSVSL